MNAEKIKSVKEQAIKEIKRANDNKTLEQIRINYLGKKGIINSFFKEIRNIPFEERAKIGALLNKARANIQENLSLKQNDFPKAEEDKLDLTLPARRINYGGIHIITQLSYEIRDIFKGLCFEFVEGKELENIYYNFEALNTPSTHPARDMQATFYVSENTVLRTHTSPVQIHFMEKHKPPLRMISIGKCFRADAPDVSHSPVFHQVEGLMIGEDVNFTHLKGILSLFFKGFFREDIEMKLIPSFFPFTEPSAEVSVKCVVCKGKGCKVCGHTGWLELFGAGMVHPNVLKNVNYNPKKWSGFAFGGGIERLAMIRHRIDDIRFFYENDIRFLSQFV